MRIASVDVADTQVNATVMRVDIRIVTHDHQILIDWQTESAVVMGEGPRLSNRMVQRAMITCMDPVSNTLFMHG